MTYNTCNYYASVINRDVARAFCWGGGANFGWSLSQHFSKWKTNFRLQLGSFDYSQIWYLKSKKHKPMLNRANRFHFVWGAIFLFLVDGFKPPMHAHELLYTIKRYHWRGIRSYYLWETYFETFDTIVCLQPKTSVSSRKWLPESDLLRGRRQIFGRREEEG